MEMAVLQTDVVSPPDIRWPIALDTPPIVVAAGIGLHGIRSVERYLLPDLWALHLYTYSATLKIDGSVIPIRPGFAGVVPASTSIQYDFHGLSQHLYVHFRCARPGDTGIGDGSILAMQDLGSDFDRIYSELEYVVSSQDKMPHFKTARFWDVINGLSERQSKSAPPMSGHHPAVRRAVAQIALRLGEPLNIPAIASVVGVSNSYLGRLFQEAFGMTIVSYIRTQRVRRAEHLLRHSTLPIKAIASLVGLRDLQYFNKVIRRELGMSPRRIRNADE